MLDDLPQWGWAVGLKGLWEGEVPSWHATEMPVELVEAVWRRHGEWVLSDGSVCEIRVPCWPDDGAWRQIGRKQLGREYQWKHFRETYIVIK
jgi:hypothetical protein